MVKVGFDFARDLLLGNDFKEALHCRYHELYDLAIELHGPTEDNSNGPIHDETEKIDLSFSEIAIGVKRIFRDL